MSLSNNWDKTRENIKNKRKTLLLTIKLYIFWCWPIQAELDTRALSFQNYVDDSREFHYSRAKTRRKIGINLLGRLFAKSKVTIFKQLWKMSQLYLFRIEVVNISSCFLNLIDKKNDDDNFMCDSKHILHL